MCVGNTKLVKGLHVHTKLHIQITALCVNADYNGVAVHNYKSLSSQDLTSVTFNMISTQSSHSSVLLHLFLTPEG